MRFDLANGYEYAESLAYLCSPPERALKGVGPKRGQQLAKLGSYWVDRWRGQEGGIRGSDNTELFFLRF